MIIEKGKQMLYHMCHYWTVGDSQGCNIGNEGARMIGEVLKTNSTLTQIDLDSEKRTKKE